MIIPDHLKSNSHHSASSDDEDMMELPDIDL